MKRRHFLKCVATLPVIRRTTSVGVGVMLYGQAKVSHAWVMTAVAVASVALSAYQMMQKRTNPVYDLLGENIRLSKEILMQTKAINKATV